MPDQEQTDDKTYCVRLIRRKDGRRYWYRHDGCLTARKESSMLLQEPVAKQLALALRTQHKDFTAVALPYRKQQKKNKEDE